MRFDPRQSNPVGILLVIVTIAGIIGALVVGRLVAQSDFIKLGAFFAAAIGIAVFLFLGRNIWLLIPLCWPLTGKIQILPIPLNVQEIAIAAAFGFYVFLLVFKKPLHHPRTGYLELFLALNLAWIGVVFIRNPVGVRAFGTEMLGGRPYFEILMACAAYWVLTRTLIPPKNARLFPILMAAGSLGVSLIGVMTTVFPRITPFVAPFYSGVDTSAYQTEVLQSTRSNDEVGRVMMLKSYGTGIFAVLTSLFRPLSLLNPIHILPFAMLLTAVAATLLSGFRSQLIGSFVGFVIASYFWGGKKDVFLSSFLVFAAIVLLVAAQTVGISLPKSAQRALSFIPADWDRAAVRDAEGSAEWRLEMWKTVLENPDKYLKNPILGAGFGFSARDLEMQLAAYNTGGEAYIGGSQHENQLISGAFHSGPLSAVRFAGIIGLILYYIVTIYMAVTGFRLVKTTRGSPYFYLSVFIATPLIYGLFSYTFIFGAYDGALQGVIFNCAMLRCVTESHRVWVVRQGMSNTSTDRTLLPSTVL